jgi:hypothetical protein
VETKEALDSQDWLNVSSESMLEFLDMECLDINEADLVRALIRWGKFQLEQQDGDTLDENLRSKILPGLQKIRFDSLTHEEVAQLCTEDFGKVLKADEKCSLFVAIIKGNWEMMPTDVVSSSKLTPRHRPYTFCPLLFDEIPVLQNFISGTLTFDFQINKTATFIGIKLNLPGCLHNTLTSITLYTWVKDKKIVLGTGDLKSTSLHRGEKFYKITSPQTLTAFKKYTMAFTFTPSKGGVLTYTLPKDKNPSCSDDLVLTVLNAHQTFRIHIQGVVFGKA